MRILVVSGYFPPFAPMSGVRAGKLAKYLLARGHEVRILAIRDLPFPPLLRLEIPERLVSYTDWIDVNGLPRAAMKLLKRLKGGGGSAEGDGSRDRVANTASASSPSLMRRVLAGYQNVTNWPDPQIGWLPYAVSEGSRLLHEAKFDLIYATVPPLTGLLVAQRLSRRCGVPWIAEFRDLWVDHPYYDAPRWRGVVERLHEARVLRTCSALVTVSDTWRDLLRRRFDKPTETVLNGFDPDDYPPDVLPPSGNSSVLEIVYTGTLYPGRRDPTPLFRAVRRLGEGASRVKMTFYGADPKDVRALAEAAGVASQVSALPAISYEKVIAVQRTADVLLLLRWNDASEQGIVPGKVFEYAAARRPILCLGYDKGDVPQLIRSRQLGLVSEDPETIARQLQDWLAAKRQASAVAPLALEARAGLSRIDQFEKLERFIETVLPRRTPGA